MRMAIETMHRAVAAMSGAAHQRRRITAVGKPPSSDHLANPFEERAACLWSRVGSPWRPAGEQLRDFGVARSSFWAAGVYTINSSRAGSVPTWRLSVAFTVRDSDG